MLVLISLMAVASLWDSWASGHGKMLVPVGRGSVWRLGMLDNKKDAAINYDDDANDCGGFAVQFGAKNGGRCGVCGDAFDQQPAPRDHESGGRYDTGGLIVANYTQGRRIEVVVRLGHSHGGYFEWRICDAGQRTEEVTQECLDENLLRLDGDGDGSTTTTSNSSGTRFHIPPGFTSGSLLVGLRLPEDLVCRRCVIQWQWTSDDRIGTCDDGTRKRGCGDQTTLRNCADVSIRAAARRAPHPETGGGEGYAGGGAGSDRSCMDGDPLARLVMQPWFDYLQRAQDAQRPTSHQQPHQPHHQHQPSSKPKLPHDDFVPI